MLAIIYDVHGNLPALDAVLTETREAGVAHYMLGGDYTTFGAWPRECLERLRELDATWLRGNWERWQGAIDRAPADELIQEAAIYANEAIGIETAHQLATLPVSAERDNTLYCHASPGSDMKSFDVPADEDGDTGTSDEHLIGDSAVSAVVFGHTHVQFRRESPSRVRLINPGSVGLPLDGDRRAAFALHHDDGSFELRRVAYDHEASAAALEQIGEPWSATIAARLRAASSDG